MYDENFYKHRRQQTQQSAELMARFLMDSVPGIDSVVDFGCGVGVWLAEFKRLGVQRVLGMDGPWVNPDLLEIGREDFRPTRLEAPVDTSVRFDLAISLEVAEHLPADAARTFVECITKASDLVLFSAAVPGQPGTHHVNAQWQSYWSALFADLGYIAFDIARPRFWKDERVRYFYRQNAVVYANGGNAGLMEALRRLPAWSTGGAGVADLAHPELLEFLLGKQGSVGGSWHLFRGNLKRRSIRQWLRGGRR